MRSSKPSRAADLIQLSCYRHFMLNMVHQRLKFAPEFPLGVYYSHYLIPKDNLIRPEPCRIVTLIEAWVEKGFVVRQENGSGRGPQRSNDSVTASGARFITSSSSGIAVEYEPEPRPQRRLWRRIWGKAQKAPPLHSWKPFSVPPVGESLSALSMPNSLIQWEGNSIATFPLQTLTEAVFQSDFRFPHSLSIELSDDFINLDTDAYGVGATQVSAVCNCGCNLGYEGSLGYFVFDRIRRICPACGCAFRPQDQIAEVVDGSNGAKFPQPGGLCHRFGIVVYFSKEHPLYVPDPNGELVEALPKVTSIFMETCRTALGVELNEFSYYA
jgi:hypothetical protein